MEKLEIMASVVEKTALNIRKNMEDSAMEALRKEFIIERAMDSLPKEIEGLNLAMTGDNWLWPSKEPGQTESLFPDITASIALTERDEMGNVISCAMAPVAWWNQWAIAASKTGLYIFNQEGFFRVNEVNPALLQLPPRVYIFGQKSTPHWVAINSIIGEMNRQGVKTQNDCGPFYGLMSWFSNFDGKGTITPRNVVYIEPYNNKPKEELMAFMVRCLNEGLNKNQFLLTTMAGRPLFEDGKFAKIPDGLYSSAGFVIAPTRQAYSDVMIAVSRAVLLDPVFLSPGANEKMKKLRQDLEE